MSIHTELTSFIRACNKAKDVIPFNGRILALDPGETTGYAVFDSTPTVVDWVEIDQISTWPEEACVCNLEILFNHIKPTRLVYESYRIYDWKSDDHKWSPVNTTQVIGCIWTLAHQKKIPIANPQSAQNAKGFWDDNRLKQYNVYFKGIRHGRDATRHALHFLCFGGK